MDTEDKNAKQSEGYRKVAVQALEGLLASVKGARSVPKFAYTVRNDTAEGMPDRSGCRTFRPSGMTHVDISIDIDFAER